VVRRVGTILAVTAAAAMVLMWGYLFLVADPGIPDELEDPAYGAAAEPVCAEVRAGIDELTPAIEVESPEERGAVVAEANAALEDLVVELEALAPTTGEDAELVDAWLADWATYLADRQAYAEDLLAGEDAELLVTARGTDQITVTLDHFAQVNDMPSCQVPLDV